MFNCIYLQYYMHFNFYLWKQDEWHFPTDNKILLRSRRSLKHFWNVAQFRDRVSVPPLPGPSADIENKLVITRKIKLSKWQLSCARPGIVWDGPMPVTIWLSCGAKFSQIISAGVTSQDVESVCNCPCNSVIIKPRKKLLWDIWFARNVPGLTGRLWRFAGT